MLNTISNLQELNSTLEAGGCLITANNHLAVHLKAQYNQMQQAASLQVWHGPQIQTWSSWINQRYIELLDQGELTSLLLNEQQERLLWEQAVRHFDNSSGLLNISSAAQTAMSAHQLLADWRVSMDDVKNTANEETLLFLDWHHYVHKLFSSNNWTPVAHLTHIVIDHVTNSTTEQPEIILAGFHEFTPVQQRLLDVLQDNNYKICLYQPPGFNSEPRLLQAADAEAETKKAINWALQHLEQYPHARIGIVVPDLNNRRPQLQRLLTESLHPGTLLPGAVETDKQFSIFMSAKLAEYPVVHDALMVLQLCLGRHSYSEIGGLLRSTFIAGSFSEQAERGTLDRELRAQGMPEFSLHFVQNHLGRRPNCPILQHSLELVQQILKSLPTEDQPANWVDHFSHILNAMGWPGERSLNSAEYQQIERFQDVLGALARLDSIRKKLTFKQAFSYFRRSTENMQFQEKSAETPIQVMGVLEASGMQFDHCWLLGFEDRVWPAAPHPNPLLPINLQRDYKLPQASPDETLNYAKLLTGKLLQCAPDIMISYPNQSGDRRCRPSPLLSHIESSSLPTSLPAELWSMAEDHILQSLSENNVLASGEDLSGGTALIADQSACPFRALANHRLGTQTLEEPKYALDARIIGSLIHHILELLWQRLQDHKTLIDMPIEKLSTLISEVVAACLPAAKQQRPDLFNEKFTQIETLRLEKLIHNWLQQEKLRLPFKAIELELKTHYLAGKLTLNMRADRIDQLDDGQHVIIDYKTGSSVNVKNWLEPRLSEPQVPLYCITGEFNPVAAAIAKVNASKCEFKGLAAITGIAKGLNEYSNWSDLLQQWKISIDKLAAEYCQGHASVTPQPGACDYCSLDSLCRVEELQNG